MKIRLIEEREEYPFCPDCNVALSFERIVYSDAQKEQISEYFGKRKRKLFTFRLRIDPEAILMRCPKCAKLYHVE